MVARARKPDPEDVQTRRITYEAIPAGESIPDADEFLSDPDDEALAFEAFQREASESESYSKLTVWRQPTGVSNRPGQKKLLFLFECGIDEYSFSQMLEKLRDDYGSGTYRIQARNEKGILLFNRSFSVERSANAQATAAPKESMAEIIGAVQTMLDGAEERFARLAPRSEAPNMFAMMKEFASLMGMMAPIFQGRVAGGDALGEIEKLLKLKELVGALGGGGADSNFYDLVGKLVDNLGPTVAAAVAAKQGAKTPQLNPPAIPQHDISMQPQTANVAPKEPAGMKSQVSILVTNAKNGVTAETMAQTILDLTPDDKLDALYSFVSAPDAVEKMAAINPEVRAHLAWFEALRKIIIEELQAPEETATVPPAS